MSNHRTPLYDWHVARQARMCPFGGWDMPVQYAGIIEEHKAVRNAAGIFDISHMARLSFDGTDTLAFLEKVFTNSVTTMKDGQVRYGLICNEAGGILDDVLVYNWPYGYSMVVNASNRAKIIAWLTKHASNTNVRINDQTDTTGMVAVQGPKSVGFMKGLFAADVAGLKYYYAMPTRYRDKPCIVSRTGYTGEDGFEVMLPNALVESLWNDWILQGAVPCGLGARDTLRLEAAMPLYGHELNEMTTPLEAGLGWAVKKDKGDFIGRDALGKISKMRIGLMLGGKRAAREGCPILDGSTPIGNITSGSYSPHLEKSIAMGYVPAGFSKSNVTVDIRGSQASAVIVSLPFYQKPKN